MGPSGLCREGKGGEWGLWAEGQGRRTNGWDNMALLLTSDAKHTRLHASGGTLPLYCAYGDAKRRAVVAAFAYQGGIIVVNSATTHGQRRCA